MRHIYEVQPQIEVVPLEDLMMLEKEPGPMRSRAIVARRLWFIVFAASGLISPVIGQVTQPATPSDAAVVSAKPSEPMVAPIQRVKPAAPKLDPRLSAQPVKAPRSSGATVTVRAKYLASKVAKAAKSKPNTTAAKAPAETTAPSTQAPPAKTQQPAAAPPVAAKPLPKPAVSQAPAGNPSPSIKR